MMSGKILIFSAPSGSGKTTIVRHLLNAFPNLEFSISACTRGKRDFEINGKDYYFLTVDEFRQKISEDEFLEWEEVYENNFYGSLKSELSRIWNKGNTVVFDIDVKGGLNIKRKYGDQALSIFVRPPSIDALESRLRYRHTENEETLKKRLDKANFEMSFSKDFDIELINDNLEQALKEAEEIVKNFLKH
ncbi:MAG: guanylate kinase [Bacteroidota bacterium]|nr:guanylate kinase [Bacteroidota bacterium]